MDEEFWKSTLPNDETLTSIAKNTRITQNSDFTRFLDPLEPRSDAPRESKHLAKGGPIYGQLTQLGLLQMIELGARLREDLRASFGADVAPSDVKLYSTDFPRTLQSLQGTLLGLFDGEGAEFSIDASYTQIMIPDPQPRNYPKQVVLEKVRRD